MRFLMCFLVVFGLGSAAFAEGGRLTVTGVGTIDVAPDMAVITLGVSHQAKEAREAVSETAKKSAAILNRLSALGIEKRDIQTSNLSLNPVYRHYDSGQARKVEGFRANNTVTLRVRDLANLGAVLAEVVQDGANQFNGLRFALQDPRPHQDEARRVAVADARAKAELYAKTANVTLGHVLELSEGGAQGPRPMAMTREMMMSDAAMPIAEGEMSVQAQVTIVFSVSE